MKSHLLIGALFIAGVTVASPNVIKVEAIGSVPLDVKDPISSRRASLLEAQRDAIEKALGVYIHADSTVDKHILTQQIIKSHTQGRILRYTTVYQHVLASEVDTKILAEVGFSSPGGDSETIEDQIRTIPVDHLSGYLQYVSGRVPTHAELVAASHDPLPALQAMYRKIKRQAGLVDDAVLAQSFARTIGVIVGANEIENFERLLNE